MMFINNAELASISPKAFMHNTNVWKEYNTVLTFIFLAGLSHVHIEYETGMRLNGANQHEAS